MPSNPKRRKRHTEVSPGAIVHVPTPEDLVPLYPPDPELTPEYEEQARQGHALDDLYPPYDFWDVQHDLGVPPVPLQERYNRPAAASPMDEATYPYPWEQDMARIVREYARLMHEGRADYIFDPGRKRYSPDDTKEFEPWPPGRPEMNASPIEPGFWDTYPEYPWWKAQARLWDAWNTWGHEGPADWVFDPEQGYEEGDVARLEVEPPEEWGSDLNFQQLLQDPTTVPPFMQAPVLGGPGLGLDYTIQELARTGPPPMSGGPGIDMDMTRDMGLSGGAASLLSLLTRLAPFAL